MSTKTKLTLSEATSRIVDVMLQSGPTNLEHAPQRFVAMRPGESQADAQRRVAVFHASRAQSEADVAKPSWLNWDEMTVLGTVESVGLAIDTYYKPERLNRDPEMRDRLVADRQQIIENEGWACIASHYDSVNGRGMYLRKLGSDLTVYMSNR